jgi:hypothetical protein
VQYSNTEKNYTTQWPFCTNFIRRVPFQARVVMMTPRGVVNIRVPAAALSLMVISAFLLLAYEVQFGGVSPLPVEQLRAGSG